MFDRRRGNAIVRSTLHAAQGGSLGKLKMCWFADHLLLIFRRDPLCYVAAHFPVYTLSNFRMIRSAH
jgi:hypothetical protein